MANFVFLLLFPLALSATSFAAERSLHGSQETSPNLHYYESFKGPDRTITWRAWKEVPGGAFRVRTGDRYLGGQKWEHYLCFEQRPEQAKAIKLSMIHLASESVEDVLLGPGSRYGILKVTNNKMTVHKGLWSWTAQEVSKDEATQSKTRLKHPSEMYKVACR
jgi:hypothetical protein